MTAHNYTSSSGRDMIMEYLNSLPEEERDDGLNVIDSMEENDFDSLICKQWEKKIWEVYFRKHNRIFYIVTDAENLYLLHACRKQKNKTEKRDARIVRQRAKELGDLLNKKFI